MDGNQGIVRAPGMPNPGYPEEATPDGAWGEEGDGISRGKVQAYRSCPVPR